MDGALVNLAHLRMAAERSQRLSARVAAAAAEAVEEVAASVVTAEQLSSVVREAVQEGIREVVSGAEGARVPLDPWEVYRSTRPADWLEMPAPEEDEMYLLFHIPEGASSLLAFTGTCTGSYTVALGSVQNGVFVQRSAVSVASGTRYEAELLAEDWGGLTSGGVRQVMIKVSGTDLLAWEPAVHSQKTSPANFAGWNIVEIACRLPKGTRVSCGNSIANKALTNLCYFAWYGENCGTDLNSMFYYCRSLTAVLELDTSKAENVGYLFSNCASLLGIPRLDTSNAGTMVYMFNNCTAIPAIAPVDTSKAASLAGMFSYCTSLTAAPPLDLSNVTVLTSAFADCHSLQEAPEWDTSRVTDMSYLFSNCYALQKIPALNTASAVALNYAFRGCRSLTEVPDLDTGKAVNLSYLFHECWALLSIPELDMTKVTSASYLFGNCYSLVRIPRLKGYKATASAAFSNCYALSSLQLDPAVEGWAGYAVSLSGCSLGHEAMVALLHSLPALTSAKALTLTGNPGVLELTDAEKAIAASKNWTLTL